MYKHYKNKMARYNGIMYQLENVLPLNTIFQIHQTLYTRILIIARQFGVFVPSDILRLFFELKRRAVTPGCIQYRYGDGTPARHTNPDF